MQIPGLKQKIRSCWLGKNIGGTLGGPFEGRAQPMALTFYDPVPTGALPNDDLDLQVVWLHHLRKAKTALVTTDIMADAWRRHVLFPFDEYGITHRNDRLGVLGAMRGSFDNYFSECMGGAIRSEIWACVAAGDAARAAAFAQVDASVDHCGEGVYAEVFHAALQAAAFLDQNRSRLIDTALSCLPPSSAIVRAIRDTQQWWHESRDWRHVRAQIVARYGTGNFTHVVCNLCFEILGWYDGDGDFGRSLCTAVNCGLDTDCTGATLGALLGIIDPDCIPSRWSAPVGEQVVLSPPIVGVPVPRDLDELTEWTLALRAQLQDVTPVVPAIVEAAPQTMPNPYVSVPASVAYGDVNEDLEAEAPAAGLKWSDVTLHGYWQRLPAVSGRRTQWYRLTVNVPTAGPIKLLAFASTALTAWVNGCPVIRTTRETLSQDSFLAPSFHRAGASSAVVEATGEPLEVVIGVALPGDKTARAADLVIGFGDPQTNLWRTDVTFDGARTPSVAG